MILSFFDYSRWRTPFFPLLASYMMGIITAYCLPGYRLISWYCLGSLFFIQVVLSLYKPCYRILALICMLCTLFAGGYYLLARQDPFEQQDHFVHCLPRMEEYEAVIVAPVIMRRRHYRTTLLVKQVKIDGEWQKASGKIAMSGWGASKRMAYGQRLRIQGAPTSVVPNRNPYMTNWALAWQSKGIAHQHHLSTKQWMIISSSPKVFLLGWLHLWRQKMTNIIQKSIEDPDIAAVVVAMLWGNRLELNEEIKALYTETGVMHILAVSGLHVGLLYYLLLLLIYWLSLLLPCLMQYQLRITWTALLGYSLITGLAPPILRAMVMLFFYQLGKWLERDIIPTNILAFTALILLLYNPYLLFSVSFQLSFIAVASMIALYVPLLANSYLPHHPWLRAWWQLIVLSLTIQIGTLPLTLYYFHGIPLYSWLANSLVVPLLTPLLFISLLSNFSCSLGLLHRWLIALLVKLLTSIHAALRLIRSLPAAYIDAIYWPLSTIFLLYGSLLAGLQRIICRKKYYTWTAFALLLAFLSKWAYDYACCQRQAKIIIYSLSPHMVIACYRGTQGLFLVEGSLERHDAIFQHAVVPSMAAMRTQQVQWYRWADCVNDPLLVTSCEEGVRYLTWQGRRIVWLLPSLLATQLPIPYVSDIWIISSHQAVRVAQHLTHYQGKLPQVVVLGACISAEQKRLNLFHWLDDQGALTITVR
ncbi:MAG: ComEC/Rec2 family competence protein [Bacteroidota bacterium]